MLLPGIQRPLKDINVLTDSIYIPKGINIPSLDRKTQWEFHPSNEYKVCSFFQLRRFCKLLHFTHRVVDSKFRGVVG